MNAGPARHPAEAWYLGRADLRNRCSVTPWRLAAQAFQEDPAGVEIDWVRAEHGGFLAAVAGIADPAERSRCFHAYAISVGWLHEDPADRPDERQRLRRSYAAVLRGWSVDSNGRSGAALKGWAEDRFGLRAIWHGAVLGRAEDAGDRFAAERARGAAGGIAAQLDLLYAFAQDELARRHPGRRWLTLYRGTHDPEAYVVRATGTGCEIVEFDCVSSFTDDPEIAWEFGSRVWEVRVPQAKVVCCAGLIPEAPLAGEGEHIVLGGDYRVVRRLA